ncbi:ATPase [Arsenicitalea aurantiaca]|uniref:ATPase n=1 Tax=Arsenicitalea aurantiaca TaxID=1783274 RepID=A0A433XFD2_9HYPH|nr:SRPBCC domain-containing protein [Arsenicitalea aurantiaca]RUT32809.1 ATPase [Arsenicitalea aurantiaca]
MSSLEVTIPTDREVLTRRRFSAPRGLVYRAHTEPDLIKRWLLGPPGWTMPECRFDARVGGSYFYRWAHPTEPGFALTGIITEIDPPDRIVSRENFDSQWTGGETEVTQDFIPDGDGTIVAQRILFASREAREAGMATGMTDGMAMSFDALERLLAELA